MYFYESNFLLFLSPFASSFAPIVRAVDPPPDGGYPNQNTAEGEDALFTLSTGVGNTAVGFNALYNDTTGGYNTATGNRALFVNTTGTSNTANGSEALLNNVSGIENTAIGAQTLVWSTGGNYNTAIGSFAPGSNTGDANTAVGQVALLHNTSGLSNTATGFQALSNNRTGNYNTATGHNAMRSNTFGSFNVALGQRAGFNLTTGSYNIDIANEGVAHESNTIRIGMPATHKTTFIAGITGATVTGSAVVVSSSGQLGVAPSSQRFKQNIHSMGEASSVLLALQPVTFQYTPKVDPNGIPQFGLVAEQVERVNPNLVARGEDGKPYTVRYEAVNAMLLNEFLKEHRKVQEQAQLNQEQETTIKGLKSTITKQNGTISDLKSALDEQQKEIQTLRAGFKEQAAQIRDVNDQLAVRGLVPQLADSR